MNGEMYVSHRKTHGMCEMLTRKPPTRNSVTLTLVQTMAASCTSLTMELIWKEEALWDLIIRVTIQMRTIGKGHASDCESFTIKRTNKCPPGSRRGTEHWPFTTGHSRADERILSSNERMLLRLSICSQQACFSLMCPSQSKTTLKTR